MSDQGRELIVFPTELSLRRFQQDEALRTGWVDASGHTTFSRLRQLCIPYSPLKGRQLTPAKRMLLQRQAVDVARGHFEGQGPLNELPDSALSDVLEALATELAVLPGEQDRIVDWMLRHSPGHKLRQLGVLYSIWRTHLQQEAYCDAVDLNRAMLRLLKGNRDHWPPLLRDAAKLTFRSVRWFNPFEEQCVSALNDRMKLSVESALPPAHADAAADRLGQRVRSEIMTQSWAVWAEDLGDALAVSSSEILQLDDADRISFSRSAGSYGEIEDLARRIARVIESTDTPPHRMALVVPDLGSVQDIVPHVFGRFRIPYFFRRGRPVLSSSCVKAFIAWLSAPVRPDRDALIDLVRNPAIRFEDREAEAGRLALQPPRVELQTLPWFSVPERCSGEDALNILNERLVEPEDHFNQQALKAVVDALKALGSQRLPLLELVGMLEKLLRNTTVRPRESHEQGVWVLNPHDAVGLDFDHLFIAGLNEGVFPGLIRQDALINDRERRALWKHLEEDGRHLPSMALPQASVTYAQESVLFLCALGMAREQLVLSCQAFDQEGNEKGESEFFRKLWNIAGWSAQESVKISPYDQWRISQLGDGCLFERHVKAQELKSPEDRLPMPGESFFQIVPLPLCRAKDEALQSIVQNGTDRESFLQDLQSDDDNGSIAHLMAMLDVEAERDTYLETPIGERVPSSYCGHIESLQDKVATWLEQKQELGATALETLARCRYIFLLEQILGIRETRAVDDMPEPLDRGRLMHTILREIYSGIAEGEANIAAPRQWAVRTAAGWIKQKRGDDEAIPLATLLPEHVEEYIEYARKVAQRRMDEVTYGHPDVWDAEREKIMQMVLNIVRHDAETCAGENRFPALFELPFEGASAIEAGGVRIRGRVDRVDLIFDKEGALHKVRVLDYKGSSRAHQKHEEYLDDIRRNLDCQLPIYAFAVQQHLFGENNTPLVNALTEMGYLFYHRDPKAIGGKLKKSLIPLDEPGLTTDFLETLSENVRRLKMGNFAVDPWVEAYTDYQSVCRTEAVAGDELE